MLHKQLQHRSCEKLCPLNITTYCCTSLLNWKYSTIMSFVLFWFVLTLSNVSIRHVLLCHRNLLTLDMWYGRCPEQYRLYQRLTSTDNASCRVASCSITTRSMITLLGLLVEPLCFLYQRESRSDVASAWSNTRKLPLLGTGLPDRGAQGIQTSYKERHPLLDLVDSETPSRL